MTALARPVALTFPARADEHPVAVYLSRLAPGSRRAMAQAVRVVAAILRVDPVAFEWATIRRQHADAVRARVADRYAPAAGNKILSALRGVLLASFDLGQMGAEDYHRAAAVKSLKGTSAPRGRAVREGEQELLFGALQPETAQGARDAALLALLFGAGLRRAEAVALDMGDFNPADGALVVRKGKGGKARTVYATNGSADALAAWLEVRGEQPGPLLLAVDKAGAVRYGKALSGAAVFAILRRLQTEAGVKAFSPHDCRRTFVTGLLAKGAPIDVVQQLAGHASVNTTARYSRAGEDAKRKAAMMVTVPFGA